MKDSHHITKFNVKFNNLAMVKSYSESCIMYYCSLTAYVTDAQVISSKPNMLEELHPEAQALDIRPPAHTISIHELKVNV